MWHGPWAWEKVQGLLEASGYPVVAVTLPGVNRREGDATFAGQCASLVADVSAIPGDVVLVGHSYAGALLGEVGDLSNVVGMVFVSGFTLDVGETVGGINDAEPGSESGDDALIHQDDLLLIDADTARGGFYHDAAPDDAQNAVARLTPEHFSTRSTPMTRAAWRNVPSQYIVTTQDRAITVDVQRRLAARLDSSVELDASHSPMLSMPRELADAISTFAGSLNGSARRQHPGHHARPADDVTGEKHEQSGLPPSTAPEDAAAIRTVVDNWVMYRDSADWRRFASVWSADGWMTATWFQGPATEFIEVSRRAFEQGVQILHFLGGFTCDVAGDRAVAQTKMKIEQRATVHDIAVDVTCTGRFYDFLEKTDNQWRLVRRQPIYESDSISPVDPAANLHLDRDQLDSFPTGYRHLAYIQQSIGYKVMQDLPGLRGDALERLYREGADWLGGSPTAGQVTRSSDAEAHTTSEHVR